MATIWSILATITLYYTTPTLAWTLSSIPGALVIPPKHTPKYFYLICALEPMPVLELVPELDPVLGLEVASEPELKPVPVLELELRFVLRSITRL